MVLKGVILKLFNGILLLALPSLSFAGTLLYPEKLVAVNDFSGQPSLEKVFTEIGLKSSVADFTLRETKQSLLGTHYDYQQTLNGIAIQGAHLVVSLDDHGQLIKCYNAVELDSNKVNKPSLPFISSDVALSAAWKKLAVTGELLEQPKMELVYSKDLNLAYKFDLSTSAPFGHWSVLVDAHSGDVISMEDSALPRMKRAAVEVKPSSAPLTRLSDALAAMEKKTLNKSINEVVAPALVVSGTAQVFDPNPVVTLGRIDLSDDMDASVFLDSYKTEELKEISFVNGVYSLKGPKIELVDFEMPSIAPSVSTDGSWIFERKNVAFNDVMTYLHLDRSMRYIESLGFVGSKAVFSQPLKVDANGLNGADNSHYIPATRRLAFGHGCVDDNEDADVILHELGHAIQHHIVSSWGGADAGAMGEGFGDYWAATYSFTTEGGENTNPHWVFKWDGHNACWEGRKLDAFTPGYNPNSTYPAHRVVNGGMSDELWSTPVFQAFVELYKRGVAREDIDRIVLEAHFGLGSGLRMPDMARAIVKTAKALYPDQDYDQVFLRHFKNQKML